MLPTLSTLSTLVRKPISLMYALLMVLALVLMSSPGSAAILQHQTPHHSDAPNATCPAGGQCFADVPSINTFYEFANRIYQQDIVTGYACVGLVSHAMRRTGHTTDLPTFVTRQQMSKFVDQARSLPGINIETSTDGAPLRSITNADDGVGVYGESTGDEGFGVHGVSTSSNGVRGISGTGTGVFGYSGTGYGVYGYSGSSYAGYFAGDIYVFGNCTGCAGPTRIDHPLDPKNKYLYHSTVQSPDMKNVYDGNVTTDDKGEAVVVLPDYFEALNRDFRYQLTVVGQFAQAIISQQVKDNRFTIRTDKPNVTVSWQVTGIRQDPYANAHHTQVEVDKPTDERGKYVHPTEWGQPESAGIDYEEQQKMQEELRQAGER